MNRSGDHAIYADAMGREIQRHRACHRVKSAFRYWHKPDIPGKVAMLCIDPMMMITPPAPLLNHQLATAAWEHMIGAPLRLISMTRSHCSSFISRKGMTGSIAALLTSMSMRPKSCSQGSVHGIDLASLRDIRPVPLSARRPFARICSAMSSAPDLAAGVVDQHMRLPHRPGAATICRPMPRPPPVTNATLSFNLIGV